MRNALRTFNLCLGTKCDVCLFLGGNSRRQQRLDAGLSLLRPLAQVARQSMDKVDGILHAVVVIVLGKERRFAGRRQQRSLRYDKNCGLVCPNILSYQYNQRVLPQLEFAFARYSELVAHRPPTCCTRWSPVCWFPTPCSRTSSTRRRWRPRP